MFLKEFFYMTRADRRTFICLCSLALVAIIFFGAVSLTDGTSNKIEERKETAMVKDESHESADGQGYAVEETNKGSKLFYFDFSLIGILSLITMLRFQITKILSQYFTRRLYKITQPKAQKYILSKYIAKALRISKGLVYYIFISQLPQHVQNTGIPSSLSISP